MINWWKIEISKKNQNNLLKAFNKKKFSEGTLTKLVEKKICKIFKVKNCILTSSGSTAIFTILMYLKYKHMNKNEVIISNRSWVSPVNAATILGLKIVIVDVKNNIPVADYSDIEKKINKNTLCIICVQLNGFSIDIANLKKGKKFKKNKPFILEDAAQSFYSKYNNRFIGTQGNAGIFSFSMGKMISSGQGGAIITNNKMLNKILRLKKNNGIINRYTDKWNMLGFNFKFTDIQASLLLDQLKKINLTKQKLIKLFEFYKKNLKDFNYIKMVHFNKSKNTIPLYIECSSKQKNKIINILKKNNIHCRKIYPLLSHSNYLNVKTKKNFSNSENFYKKSFYFPSGPDQNYNKIKKIFKILKKINEK